MPRSPDSIHRKQLSDDFSIADVFDRFAQRPGCLWLDSAASLPRHLTRYSFLCSDPTDTIVADAGDPNKNPWPLISQWCQRLPSSIDPDLPPFQGGIAGLVGYEAGGWLQETGPAPIRDAGGEAATPAVSLGWYPWTIAVDHHLGQAWIIAHSEPDLQFAQSILSSPPPKSLATPASAAKAVSQPDHPTHIDTVTSNFSSDKFRDSVNDIVRRIRAGDSFQVNLAQRLTTVLAEPVQNLYLRLRQTNPAPFAAYYNGGDFQVLSSSPEGFLQVRDGHIKTRPIKGTVSRSEDDQKNKRLASELTASEKDRAENVMIVDLMRNDLSRVCTDDSVRVSQLCELETYQYVQHLVSVVEGDLRKDQDAVSLLKACFPGGSVTGAPKIEAMRTITELEHHPRGPYCGSIGYISTATDADFNILIRTITSLGGQLHLPVGGGITARSDAAKEEEETWTKAKGMLRAVLPDAELT